MVLETPLLRVSRPVAACSRCRSAKVKCDGKLPACTACERANRAAECSSTNDQFAKGKERSYVATLESRVEKLERRIAEARGRRKSSVAMWDTASATPTQVSVDVNGTRRPSRRAMLRKEASDIDDLVSDFGFLAVNATARDFYGFTSAMSYARLILSASTKEPLPSGMTKILPPRYATSPLVQHYLNSFFLLLPFFDEASFYASVDAVYSTDPRKAAPFDHWIVRMVLAIASASLSEQRGDTHYSDAVGHVNAALECAEQVLHPGSIASIQALLLLVQYAVLDPHHFDSWTLIGAASRAMVDLGMHQDPTKSSGMTKSKIELRRRVYHCLYALDRSTSLVQTRAFSFSDDSANVAMPFSSSSTSPSNKSAAKHHVWLQSFDAARDFFRLRQLQSSWYTTLFQSGRTPWPDPYPYIWRTYNGMTAWFNDLPASTLSATKAYFELELLYSYVYILSSSPRCPTISPYAQRLIFEHCIAYATKTLALMSDYSSKSARPPATFYDLMRVYMTGRQFVDVLIRNQDSLLSGSTPLPPATSPLVEEDADPLTPAADTLPPPLPTPHDANGQPSTGSSLSPTARSINAINDFTTILSQLGVRFGYVNWRDRFQRESAQLLAQLYQREQQREMEQGYCTWSPEAMPGMPTTGAMRPPYAASVSPSYNPAYPHQEPTGSVRTGWTAIGSAAGGQRYPFPVASTSEGGMPAPAVQAPVDGMGLESWTAFETLPGGSLNVRFALDDFGSGFNLLNPQS